MSRRGVRKRRRLQANFGWKLIGRSANGKHVAYLHPISGWAVVIDDLTGAFDVETRGSLPSGPTAMTGTVHLNPKVVT